MILSPMILVIFFSIASICSSRASVLNMPDIKLTEKTQCSMLAIKHL